MVNSEIRRYTMNEPARACSYFYGYNQLRELRADTEKTLATNSTLDQGLRAPRQQLARRD